MARHLVEPVIVQSAYEWLLSFALLVTRDS